MHSKFNTSPSQLSGFVCPECMQQFDTPDNLLVHFDSNHSNNHQPPCHSDAPTVSQEDPVRNLNSYPNQTGKSNDSVNQHVDQTSEIIAQNSELIERFECSQNKITELEAVLNLIIDQQPLPKDLALNKDLETKIEKLLDRQSEFASIASKFDLADLDQFTGIKNVSTVDFALQTSCNELAAEAKLNLYEQLKKDYEVQLEQMRNVENNLLNENEHLTLENDFLKEQLLNTQKLLEEKTEQSTALTLQTNQQNCELLEQVVKLESELANRKMQLLTLESQLKELKMANVRLTKNSDISHDRQLALTSELEKLNEKTRNMSAQFETEINELNKKLTESLNTNSDLQAERDELKSKVKCTAQYDEKMVQLENEIIRLKDSSQKQSFSSKREINSLMEKLINAEDQLSALQIQLDSKDQKIRELQSAMLDLGRQNQSLQVLRAKTTGRQWIRDKEAVVCSACNQEFSVSNRRHHCRHCGGVFCQNCSSFRASTASSKDPVRVCQACYNELIGGT